MRLFSTFTQSNGLTGYPNYGAGLVRTYTPNPFGGYQINKLVGIGTNIVGIASNGYFAYANQNNLTKWYPGRIGTNHLNGIAHNGISTNYSVATTNDKGFVYVSGIN